MSKEASKTLVVIDGMAYAFRAFYAVPEMTNSAGQATNAIYGFANALRRAEKQFKPSLAVVAYDSPGGSFRDEMLAEYKGHRDAPPEALVSQFPLIEQMVDMMGWHLIKRLRFEADDIIATLVKAGRKAGYEVTVMTSDKDILQLVGDGVRVYRENPKGASLYGPAEVKERYGVGPESILDLLGLMGDTSDNIPGVPGVGEKTAAKLLNEYGTMEKVLKAAPKMKPGKLMENLQTFAEQARLSRRLAELREDVELGKHLKEMTFNGPDYTRLLPWFKQMEMRSLLTDYSQRATVAGMDAAAAMAGPVPGAAPAPGATKKAKAKAAKPIIVLKTGAGASELKKAGLDLKAVCGVCLHPEPAPGGPEPTRVLLAQESLRLKVAVGSYEGLRDLLGALEQPALFATKPLQRCLLLAGLEPLETPLDLGLGAWLVNSTREARDLSEAAGALGLGLDLPTQQADLFETSDDDLTKLAGGADETGRALVKRLKADDMKELYFGLEAPLVPLLAQMEIDGIKIDTAVLADLDREAQKEMKRLQTAAVKAAGRDFNLNSPSQLSVILFEELKLPHARKTKTGYSTDNEVLEGLEDQHPLPRLALDFRQLAKLSGTYLQALPKLVDPADGRVHSTWNQTGTATGRISSLDPNLQNIPVRTELGREIRKAFVPGKKGDFILAADYSQIELRVLAHYCGDPVLKKAFQTGRDIHTETAVRMFNVQAEAVTKEMRSRAKVINFGVLYGMGAFRIAREFGVPMREGKQFLDDYFNQFPTVRAFLEECKEQTRKDGYASTLLKRRRPIPEINSANRVLREQGERIATNLPIQGTAADMIKKAMLDVVALLKKKKARTRLMLQVHDELVFELAREEADELPPLIKKAMEQAMKLDVPVTVELGQGRSWADAKG